MRIALQHEHRCKQCRALLGKETHGCLSIRRGDMQFTVAGQDCKVSVNCYRCQTINDMTPKKPAEPVVEAIG